MNIKGFSIKVSKEEAEKIAKSRGGFLGFVFLPGKKVHEMRMHYVEYKLLTFELKYNPNFIEKYLMHKNEIKTQTITILANGSTGSAAWVDSMPEIVNLKNIDENSIQFSDKDEELLINKGRKLASRVVHRYIGRIPEVKLIKSESIFRPFWVAFYGEVKQNQKVYYVPISADGCGSHRSF